MKKPTKEEWMKHATKLLVETKLNDYVFDPKTSPQIQFKNPKSLEKITILDEIKPLPKRKEPKLDTTVTIRVPMTKKEVTAYVGKPCKDREVGCPTCDAWREWHLNYRYVTVQVDRAEMIALMTRGRL
jgi:hypothetical protein